MRASGLAGGFLFLKTPTFAPLSACAKVLADKRMVSPPAQMRDDLKAGLQKIVK
jgi:hypothetical protein